MLHYVLVYSVFLCFFYIIYQHTDRTETMKVEYIDKILNLQYTRLDGN